MSAFLLREILVPVAPSPDPTASPFNGVRTALSRYLLPRQPAPVERQFAATEDRNVRPLPATARLLTDGGDMRIVCDAKGTNRYGCSSIPTPDVLAYGSSTASTVSVSGFAAADALRNRLDDAIQFDHPATVYEREVDRLRADLKAQCGLAEVPGLDIIFGASGTDLHLFASQLMLDARATAPVIIRVESTETGRGVPDALAGRHFSDCAALGDAVVSSAPLDCGAAIEIVAVNCRDGEGTLRPVPDVDREIETAVVRAAQAGRRVLLTLVDVSKTGFIAPSPACALALKRRFPDQVDVLVDACQFRLATGTLRSYLEADFIVAITGSKFITGPTFCGALLVPRKTAQRLRGRSLPAALRSYSARADWPRHWAAREVLRGVPNFGLLLRWEAALAELRAFRQLPEAAVAQFIRDFARAITARLSNDPVLEPVPLSSLDRGEIGTPESWDQLPTIFPFLLQRTSLDGKRTPLTPAETRKVHDALREQHCQVGQPVECGQRAGAPVSALRLCLSSRLIVDALAPAGRGPAEVIAEALTVLDQVAALVG